MCNTPLLKGFLALFALGFVLGAMSGCESGEQTPSTSFQTEPAAEPAPEPEGSGEEIVGETPQVIATVEPPEPLVEVFELLDGNPVDVLSREYEISFDLSRQCAFITERSSVSVAGQQPQQTLHLYLNDHVDEILELSDVDGQFEATFDIAHESEHLGRQVRVLSVTLSPPLEPGQTVELVFRARSRTQIGNPTWRIQEDGVQLMLAKPLLSENPPWERSGDIRHLRWSFGLTVEVPEAFRVVAALESLGDEVTDGERVARFGPLSARTYLILSAAPFEIRQFELSDGLPVELWTRSGTELHPDIEGSLIPLMIDALERYQQWLGRLPIDVFQIVEYDATFFGSEVTAPRGYLGGVWLPTSFFTSAISEPWVHARAGEFNKHRLFFHELAHSWWVGLISLEGPGSWFLSEGLCNYMAAWIAGELVDGDLREELFAGYRARWAEAAEEEPPLTEVDFYHNSASLALVYNRGGLVLLALEDHLGRASLHDSLASFAEEFSDDYAGIEDFEQQVFEAIGEDISGMIDQLVRAPGVADYAITNQTLTETGLVVTVENRGTAMVPAPLYAITGPNEGVIMVEIAPGQTQTYEIDVPPGANVESLEFDPVRMRLVNLSE